MEENSLVIKHGNFSLKVTRNETVSVLRLKCVYISKDQYWSWYRLLTNDTKLRTSSTTEVPVDLKQMWEAFRDHHNDSNQENVSFPTEVAHSYDSLPIYVYTKKEERLLKNIIKLFPVMFTPNEGFQEHVYLTLKPYIREFEANRTSEHVYNRKLQALERSYNAKLSMLEKRQDAKILELKRVFSTGNSTSDTRDETLASSIFSDVSIQNIMEEIRTGMTDIKDSCSRYLQTRIDELSSKLDVSNQKIRELEEKNLTLTSTLETVVSQLKTQCIPVKYSVLEKEEPIDENPVKVCDLADPLTYSGLVMIPGKLTDGAKTFTRKICSEAVFYTFGNSARIVINYCVWEDDNHKNVATSFHIHMCYPDQSVVSGVYIDAYSASNTIKPVTVFQNIVTQYELSIIDGDNLSKSSPNDYMIVDEITASITIPVHKSNRKFSICHDVKFQSYVGIKKYQKIVHLYDGTHVMSFSDIQKACDCRTDNYTNIQDQEYVTACLNYDILTDFC